MKKLLGFSLLLAVASTFTFEKALAQSASNDPNISGEMGNPASAPVLKVLFLRTHTLSIDSHIADMYKDGVTERAFVAGFTIEGAIAYDHEINGDGLLPELKAGRNAGLQIIPYKLTMADDGRVYISTSAVAFKNMNSEVADDDLNIVDTYYKDADDSTWRVIDQLGFVNFEYNKDIALGIEEKRISIASIDIKVGAFESKDKKFFIALKAGATPVGWHETMIQDLEGNAQTLKGFETEIRYGLQMVKKTDNGWRYDAGVDFKNRWSFDERHVSQMRQNQYQIELGQYNSNMAVYNANREAYNAALAQWNADKLEFEQENGYAPISDESYAVMSGNAKPTFNQGAPGEPGKPDAARTIRNLYLATPSITVSKTIKTKAKTPLRVGVGVSANLPVGDLIHGELNQSIMNRGNQSLVTGKIFLNF
jgi:hypothetical protein